MTIAMEEPELTPRKLLVAATCLLGATFVPYVEAIIGPMMMLPMSGEFGWTRTQYSFATTFMFFAGAVTGLLFGRVADRFGPRIVLLVGAVCGGVTMLLLSLQDGQLWKLYLAYGALGAFGSTGLGYTKIIGTLFVRHRGKALALFGAETMLAMATLPLLTSFLIVGQGWRGTYVAYGLIMLVMSAVLFLVIRGPGLSGPAAGPRNAAAAGEASATAPLAEGLTPPQFRRDRTFWLILLAGVLTAGLYAGMLTHIIAAITDKGFSPTTAAGVLSVATLAGIVGTLAAGFAMDHFRTARFLSAFSLTATLGILLFAIGNAAFGGLVLVVTGLAVLRAAVAGMMPGTTYMLTRFVGMRAFGEAFAMVVFVQGIAMGLASPLFGIIFDRTGSYAGVYWIMGTGTAIAAALYLTALGPYRYNAANVPKQRP
jgi:MFS family permease